MTQHEREWWIIYAIIVAGKSAKFAENVMVDLIPERHKAAPFDFIRKKIHHKRLLERLENARSGNYKRIEKALTELVQSKIDLHTCKPWQLEVIHGIGAKTARFYIMLDRPESRFAALDVHVLRWLGKLGYTVSKQTPSGKEYARLEKIFLREADERGKTPRQLDYEIWDNGRRGTA